MKTCSSIEHKSGATVSNLCKDISECHQFLLPILLGDHLPTVLHHKSEVGSWIDDEYETEARPTL